MNAATGMIRRLALVTVCIGLLAFSATQHAEAGVIHGGDPESAADAQRAACKAMGGTTTTLPTLPQPGDDGNTIYCTGTVTGGDWGCANTDNYTLCFPLRVNLPPSGDFDSSLLTDAEVLGDPEGPESSVGAYVEHLTWQALATQAPADGPSVAAPDDDQDQDTNKGKGKKHKKGKRGGKWRK